MAFFGIEIKSGKPFTFQRNSDKGRLHLSQATLGNGSTAGKILVQCNVGSKSPVLLCSLLPDKFENCPLNLEFEEDDEVVFSVLGPRNVHLTGYYLGPNRDQGESLDSQGEDIAETEESSKDSSKDEDEYEDDFIDDGDLEVFPNSDLSTSPVQFVKINGDDHLDENNTSSQLKRRRLVIDSGSSDENMDLDIPYKVEVNQDLLTSGSIASAVDTVVATETKLKKKKKKARAHGVNEYIEEKNDPVRVSDEQEVSSSDGLIIENISIGELDGRIALPGNKVSIYYTGKLKKGGKVFQSNIGEKPLKFRLGKGRVIEALDLGINGMRIGDKRRLTVPPTLGYGTDGLGDIPGDAWLVYDVELVKVR